VEPTHICIGHKLWNTVDAFDELWKLGVIGSVVSPTPAIQPHASEQAHGTFSGYVDIIRIGTIYDLAYALRPGQFHFGIARCRSLGKHGGIYVFEMISIIPGIAFYVPEGGGHTIYLIWGIVCDDEDFSMHRPSSLNDLNLMSYSRVFNVCSQSSLVSNLNFIRAG
jgi:hypothetical protein